jgi:hypothetical protein
MKEENPLNHILVNKIDKKMNDKLSIFSEYNKNKINNFFEY